MGTYYNPGTDILDGRVGRRLHNVWTYRQAKSCLRMGEHLYACIEFTTHTAAVCIDDSREFDALLEACPFFDFYALTELQNSRSPK